MSRLPTLARHPNAGLVEGLRAAVRFSQATARPPADAPDTGVVTGETLLLPGRSRIGPCELSVGLETQGSRALIDAAVRNAGDEPIRVEALILGFRWRDHGLRDPSFLRHGHQSWSFTGGRPLDPDGEPVFPSGAWLRSMFASLGQPPADRAGWHESEMFTAVGGRDGESALVAGALERGTSFATVYLRRDGTGAAGATDHALRLEVEQRLEIVLGPGEERRLEPVRIALGDRAPRLVEEHLSDHGREANARTSARLPVGWCSWYQFFHDVSEPDVVRNLDALVRHRDEIPVEVFQLDDGYQRAIGDWLETNEKFPRGLEPLAEQIAEAGFTPGLWTAPWLVAPESRIVEAHPEWLLRDGDGPHRALHHGAWSRAGWIHALDPTRDEVLRHLEDTFATLARMGFRYHKLDFLFAVSMPCEAADDGVTRAERLRRALDAVRRGAGEGVFLLGCGCPLGPAVGVVDAMRIGPDVAPSWDVSAPVRIPGIENTQPSTANALRNVLARAPMHRRLWINDPDCLMARSSDTALAPHETQALADLIGGTGGAVFYSDDWPNLAEADRHRIRQTVERARRVDRLARRGRIEVQGLLTDETAHGVRVARGARSEATLLNAGETPAPRALGPLSPGTLAPRTTATGAWPEAPFLAVFCDFDGTFLVQDVGATLARRYVPERRPVEWARFERHEITAWEYNQAVVDGMPCPENELVAFLETLELDPGARALVAWCEERGVPFRILSDGFDRNLESLRDRFGVDFDFDSNHMHYEHGVWRIAAGHPNPDCGCGTGTCKRGRIERYRALHPGHRTVHIGNGRVSDFCGCDAADFAFAKDTLATELEARGVPFERFTTLHDVVASLDRLVADPKAFGPSGAAS